MNPAQTGFLLVNLDFLGFGTKFLERTCREWSEQLDMVDTDHFGFGILQNHQRFVRKWTKLFYDFSLKVFDLF